MKKSKVIAGIVFLALVFVAHHYELNSENLFIIFQENRKTLLNFVFQNYTLSFFIYFALLIFTIISTLPFAALLTTIGGFIFGISLGAFYSYFSSLIGILFSFLMFRYFFGDSVKKKYIKRFDSHFKKLEDNGAYFLLSLYLFTVVPFFITSALASVSMISIRTFILITAIGIVPGILVYSVLGNQLGCISTLNEILSPSVLSMFFLLGVIGLIPMLFKNRYMF